MINVSSIEFLIAASAAPPQQPGGSQSVLAHNPARAPRRNACGMAGRGQALRFSGIVHVRVGGAAVPPLRPAHRRQC